MHFIMFHKFIGRATFRPTNLSPFKRNPNGTHFKAYSWLEKILLLQKCFFIQFGMNYFSIKAKNILSKVQISLESLSDWIAIYRFESHCILNQIQLLLRINYELQLLICRKPISEILTLVHKLSSKRRETKKKPTIVCLFKDRENNA